MVWAVSLIKCEYPTHKYYDDFKYGYKENDMFGTGGSASDVIWPYRWHFIYGGL